MTGTMLRAPGTWLLLLASVLFSATLFVKQLERWITRGLDLQEVFDLQQRRAASFEVQREVINQRTEQRRAIATAVQRGELSLNEAATRFRVMDRWTPVETWADLRRQHPDLTEEAFDRLTVLEFIKNCLVAPVPSHSQGSGERLSKTDTIDRPTRELALHSLSLEP